MSRVVDVISITNDVDQGHVEALSCWRGTPGRTVPAVGACDFGVGECA